MSLLISTVQKVLVTGNDIICVVFLPLDTKIIAASIPLHTIAETKSMEPYRSAYLLPDMHFCSALCALRTLRRRNPSARHGSVSMLGCLISELDCCRALFLRITGCMTARVM